MQLDDYVCRTLMRDLVGHDRAPSAFLVYLHLWTETEAAGSKEVDRSYQEIAESSGLSRSSAHAAIRHLLKRRLITQHKPSRTTTPVYRVLRPWNPRALK